jgi:hypothetical protein
MLLSLQKTAGGCHCSTNKRLEGAGPGKKARAPWSNVIVHNLQAEWWEMWATCEQNVQLADMLLHFFFVF